MSRSRVHMLTVAAARLEQDHVNPKLVADLRAAAKAEATKSAEGRTWSPEEEKRIQRQRTLFNMLPNGSDKAKLLNAMLQRAYDLLCDGDALACDAVLEFLPSEDARKLLDAWSADSESDQKAQKSVWWHGEHKVI